MTPDVADEQRSPLRDLVRHTFVYGSGYVTMAIVSFVLVPVYTRHMSPSEYGLLGLMLVLYGLMTTVYDLGFTNSVGRFFFDSDGEDGGASLAGMRATSLIFLACFGGFLTAVLCIFAPTWSDLLTQTRSHADLVRIVAATLYFECLAIVPLTLIRMQERSQLFIAITITRFVVTGTLSIVFVVVMDLGVRGALLANAGSGAGVLLVLLPSFLGAFRLRPSMPLLGEMLRFGVPFFPVVLSGWFVEASDRYLLGLYRTKAEVGYYVLGYKVAQVMQIATAAFSMGWAPLRYRIYQRPDAQDVYRRLATYYVFGAMTLTVPLALFSRAIVSLVAPANYASAATIVPWIGFAYGLNGLFVLMVTGMGVSKRTAPMAWIVSVAAAVNIGINIVAIPHWGLKAAAWTTVLANVLMVAGSWYWSQRAYPISYDWSRMLRTMAIGIAVVAVVVLAAPGTGLAGILAAAAGSLLFVALLVTSTISADERERGRAVAQGLRRRVFGGPRRPQETVG
jgi:O-antigen/teichoic acid export membrane protein